MRHNIMLVNLRPHVTCIHVCSKTGGTMVEVVFLSFLFLLDT